MGFVHYYVVLVKYVIIKNQDNTLHSNFLIYSIEILFIV